MKCDGTCTVYFVVSDHKSEGDLVCRSKLTWFVLEVKSEVRNYVS
jgi:hypothetical protein